MLLFEKLSNNMAAGIAKTLNADTDRKEVIAYGAYIILDTLLAICAVVILGLIFGVLFEALVVSFTTAILRKTSGGAHAETPFRCASIGAIVAVVFALIVNSIKPFINFYITIVFMAVTFLVSYYLILKLAPKDSPNKPIVKEKKIIALKFKSIRILSIYFLICCLLIIFSYYTQRQDLLKYMLLICLGSVWQSFTLTSFGHSTLKIMELPFRLIKLGR